MNNYTNEDNICTMVDRAPAKTLSLYQPNISYIDKKNSSIYGLSCGPRYKPAYPAADRVADLSLIAVEKCLKQSGEGWEQQPIEFSQVLYQQKIINCISNYVMKSPERFLCKEDGDISLTVYYRNISKVSTYSARTFSQNMPIIINGNDNLSLLIYCYEY